MPDDGPTAGEPGAVLRHCPLLPTQWGIWFHEQLRPGTGVYNSPWTVRYSGPLHVPALRAAVREIARRHEALRVRIRAHDGAPVQIVDDALLPEWRYHDLASLDPQAREKRLADLTRRAAVRPFELTTGP